MIDHSKVTVFGCSPADSGQRPRAVCFDLLTALLDSWSLWKEVAGSRELGIRWRKRYLELAYGAGAYRSCEELMRQAAAECGPAPAAADQLISRWGELEPWPEALDVLALLRGRLPLGVVTNCSVALAQVALARFDSFDATVIAEEVGFYKPRPEMYLTALETLQLSPACVVFVAGSPGDVAGAAAVGMPVYWHNRLGLSLRPEAARPKWNEPTLAALPKKIV